MKNFLIVILVIVGATLVWAVLQLNIQALDAHANYGYEIDGPVGWGFADSYTTDTAGCIDFVGTNGAVIGTSTYHFCDYRIIPQ